MKLSKIILSPPTPYLLQPELELLAFLLHYGREDHAAEEGDDGCEDDEAADYEGREVGDEARVEELHQDGNEHGG